MLLSVVIPCYNEEAVLPEMHRNLVDVLSRLEGLDFELIYVDDGCRDNTAKIISGFQASDRRVRMLRLSRNFGHQIAVTAGIEHTSGDAVVLIDADLQDPPEVIADMVAQWRNGYDVVYGIRASRKGESVLKVWTAKAFYRLAARLAEIPMPLDTGDFRLMDRKVVDALLAMPERHRLIRAMVAWVGFRQIGVSYQRVPRQAGRSKYPLSKMIRLAADGVVSTSLVPLRFVTLLGFGAFGLSILGIIYALVLRLFTRIWVPGWTALFIAVLFMGGVQLISLGIIGEYIGRIYSESKRRPLYLVLEKLGFEERKG